ncbi:glycoside hydrolase family 95 protein [Pedobacter puniceum]|uniref:Glycoside hydrolase family 95 protein n=1 Tax=Pedobacter puniceum TaxID=2666136 RepID=A0A7K0FLQ4_9SPHI|nr:glycoside hydrolase family 95 protein [Pedobacter puniceum]MRX46906.1 glycoside hydrolase family 95 protein [Pedobacter puniceum]
MRNIFSIILFVLLFNPKEIKAFFKGIDNKLWYKRAAEVWEEALPMGNAKTGAMIFGHYKHERLQLNNNTLWSGYPQSGNNPKGKNALPLVRQAVLEGEYDKAKDIWRNNLQGSYSARYLPMADLFINFNYKGLHVKSYKRELDLNHAIHQVSYQVGNVIYNRETFISYPDKALVMKITASKPHAINFTTRLTSKLRFKTATLTNDYLVLKGKAPKHVAHRASEPQQIVYDEQEGMTFEVHLKIKVEDGVTVSNDDEITVNNATSVFIYLTDATSYNGFNKSPVLEGKNPEIEAVSDLNKIIAKSYEEIKNRHLNDYKSLFDRVQFKLPVNHKLSKLPTDERLKRQGIKGNDQGLQALYFNYGRYLMISGSRPGSVPTNLQGIWNNLVQPPWGSNYTTNINTQMNYWPAENTNLSELHQPLFDFMEFWAINGRETIKTNYGIEEGWTLHHNSDIWAKTSPSGGYDWDPISDPSWSAWVMGSPWFSTHLHEHFLYTGDYKFLEQKAYPLMKGAALFLLNWLQKDEKGNFVTNPSTSPENLFKINGKSYAISMASTMDMAISKEFFLAFIKTSELLQIDEELRNRVKNAYQKLYPYQIGQFGQLQEWFTDWDDYKDTHRHVSHLFGLFPGTHITPKNTPDLAAASQKSLVLRGDVSTGWSMAWKINWWSRLQDGNQALRVLKSGLTYIDPLKYYNKEIGSASFKSGLPFNAGGTYPNLLDAHPPFQIDGNYGATAGIVEMLMQSHTDAIELLPALPEEWREGEIKGIKARGNFTIDMKWNAGSLNEALILSNIGGNCRVQTSTPVKVVGYIFKTAEGKNNNPLFNSPINMKYENHSKEVIVPVKQHVGYTIDFMTEAGKTYKIVPVND